MHSPKSLTVKYSSIIIRLEWVKEVVEIESWLLSLTV